MFIINETTNLFGKSWVGFEHENAQITSKHKHENHKFRFSVHSSSSLWHFHSLISVHRHQRSFTVLWLKNKKQWQQNQTKISSTICMTTHQIINNIQASAGSLTGQEHSGFRQIWKYHRCENKPYEPSQWLIMSSVLHHWGPSGFVDIKRAS